MPEENDYVRDMASRYTGQAKRAQRPPVRRAVPPSSRVLPQVSRDAADVIEGSGGLFAGSWTRYLQAMGLRSETSPRQVLRSGMRGVFEAGEEISQALEDSRGYYGGVKPKTGTGYRDEGADWGDVGDAEDILRGMDPALVARLQDRLVSAGFMSGGAAGIGNPTDEKTVDAFRGLLGFANSQSTTWEEALAYSERMADELGLDKDGNERAAFVKPIYLAPRYEELADSVRGEMKRMLGRDPDESEMALLTAELSGIDRDAFEAEAEAMRLKYDADTAAAEGAEGQGGATVVGRVDDPAAVFREKFREKFASELSGIERTEEATKAGNAARGAVGIISQMSGGMG